MLQPEHNLPAPSRFGDSRWHWDAMDSGRWPEILNEAVRVVSIEDFPPHARILAAYAGSLAAAKLGRNEESDYLRLQAQSLESTIATPDPYASWLGKLAYAHVHEVDRLNVSSKLAEPTAVLAREYLELCRDSDADGALLVQSGEVLGSFYGRRLEGPNEPVQLMSTSKSILAMAALMLVERGKLNLDEPVSHLLAQSRWMSWNRPAMALDSDAYVAWNELPKSAVTTRQLLLHVSGLPKNGANLTYQSSNEFMHIPLVSPPGERFNYSNVGAEVLGVVLSVAAGRFLHEFIYRELYAPLGLRSGRFSRSAEGYPFVAGSMQLGMHDLAALGELIAAGGTLHGKKILSPQAVDEMLRPGTLSRADAEQSAVENDVTLASGMMWWRDLRHDIVQTWGYLHNDLLVLPKSGLVAVRLQALPPSPQAGADGRTFALQRAELLERLSAQLSQ